MAINVINQIQINDSWIPNEVLDSFDIGIIPETKSKSYRSTVFYPLEHKMGKRVLFNCHDELDIDKFIKYNNDINNALSGQDIVVTPKYFLNDKGDYVTKFDDKRFLCREHFEGFTLQELLEDYCNMQEIYVNNEFRVIKTKEFEDFNYFKLKSKFNEKTKTINDFDIYSYWRLGINPEKIVDYVANSGMKLHSQFGGYDLMLGGHRSSFIFYMLSKGVGLVHEKTKGKYESKDEDYINVFNEKIKSLKRYDDYFKEPLRELDKPNRNDLSIVLGDLRPRNILIANHNGLPQIVLFDTDSARYSIRSVDLNNFSTDSKWGVFNKCMSYSAKDCVKKTLSNISSSLCKSFDYGYMDCVGINLMSHKELEIGKYWLSNKLLAQDDLGILLKLHSFELENLPSMDVKDFSDYKFYRGLLIGNNFEVYNPLTGIVFDGNKIITLRDNYSNLFGIIKKEFTER